MATRKTETNDAIPKKPVKAGSFSIFASVKMTILTLALIAITVLVGAWCPQESQVGREKVFEAFGNQAAPVLIQMGVADIFHTPWFLFLIAMLTLNMVACSFQRVFPKIRSLKTPMPVLSAKAIVKLPYNRAIGLPISAANNATFVLDRLAEALKKRHFKVDRQDSSLIAEYGKPGRLSATITHIGLLTLLAGVTVTSWTGFSGFAPVKPGKSLSFSESEHSKLWIGKLPQWQVRVESTARENYPTGQPKQWYSDLSVVDGDGRVLKSGQISVNNPLTYEGVDIYQASWGLAAIEVAFSGQVKEMNLEQMGNRYASFLPLDKDSILIFSVSDQKSPLRLFAKRTEWETPKRIAEIKPGESIDLGGVKLLFKRVIPITGLQYKCDPGINIVFVGFAFIITGVMLAAIPFRHVWAHAAKIDDNETETALKIPVDTILYIGGRSIKARVGFEIMLEQIIASQFGDGIQVDPQSGSECDSRSSNDEKLLALGSRENSD